MNVCRRDFEETKYVLVKSYEGKVNTSFHNDRMPEEGPHSICLSAVLIDSIFKIAKNYYPQVFLEGCK